MAAEPQPKKRPSVVFGCPSCIARLKDGEGPRHWASDRCQSGKRSHCSCGVCF